MRRRIEPLLALALCGAACADGPVTGPATHLEPPSRSAASLATTLAGAGIPGLDIGQAGTVAFDALAISDAGLIVGRPGVVWNPDPIQVSDPAVLNVELAFAGGDRYAAGTVWWPNQELQFWDGALHALAAPGVTVQWLVAMNESGWVVASGRESLPGGGERDLAIVWRPGEAGGPPTVAYTAPDVRAMAINGSGVVAGERRIGTTVYRRPVVARPDGSVIELPLITEDGVEYYTTNTRLIADDGRVLGGGHSDDALPGVLVWTPDGDGGYTLHAIPGTVAAVPSSTNDHGWIAMVSFAQPGVVNGFVWDGATMHLLGPAAYWAPPIVNDDGLVAFNRPDGAAIWKDGVTSRLLPAPGGYAEMQDMNAAGDAVGYTEYVDDSGRFVRTATLWRTGIPTIDGLASLIDAAVAAGELPAHEARPLLAKLDAAADAIDDGRTRAGVGQIQAFINQLEALARAGRMDPDRTDALIAEALRLIAFLESTG